MGLSAVTYALAKKYTDETAAQFGGLKGAPCKVKSVEKTDGRSVITLEWENNAGETRTTEVYVNDGISIWISGRDYAINDIVAKNEILYICKVSNSDIAFDNNKWDVIMNSCGDYYVIDTIAQRPTNLTSTDRRIYYCISEEKSYLWDGIRWSIISSGGGPGATYRELTQAEYDALSPAEKMNGVIYFVTDETTTDDYNDLDNKPQINSTTLIGNKNTSDLNLVDGTSIYVDENGKLAIAEVEIPEANIEDLFP